MAAVATAASGYGGYEQQGYGGQDYGQMPATAAACRRTSRLRPMMTSRRGSSRWLRRREEGPGAADDAGGGGGAANLPSVPLRPRRQASRATMTT